MHPPLSSAATRMTPLPSRLLRKRSFFIFDSSLLPFHSSCSYVRSSRSVGVASIQQEKTGGSDDEETPTAASRMKGPPAPSQRSAPRSSRQSQSNSSVAVPIHMCVLFHLPCCPGSCNPPCFVTGLPLLDLCLLPPLLKVLESRLWTSSLCFYFCLLSTLTTLLGIRVLSTP